MWSTAHLNARKDVLITGFTTIHLVNLTHRRRGSIFQNYYHLVLLWPKSQWSVQKCKSSCKLLNFQIQTLLSSQMTRNARVSTYGTRRVSSLTDNHSVGTHAYCQCLDLRAEESYIIKHVKLPCRWETSIKYTAISNLWKQLSSCFWLQGYMGSSPLSSVYQQRLDHYPTWTPFMMQYKFKGSWSAIRYCRWRENA